MKSFRQYITEARQKIDVAGIVSELPDTPFFKHVSSQLVPEALPDVLRTTLKQYSSYGHRPMNDMLRGKLSDLPKQFWTELDDQRLEKTRTSIEHMKTLFSQHAVVSPRPMTVYRVMPIQNIKSGPHAGFMSTSVNPKWAFQGAEISGGYPRTDAVLRLHIPAGTPHIPVTNPDFSFENEILLNHGTHVHVHPRVTSVRLVRTPSSWAGDRPKTRTQDIPVYHGIVVPPSSD